MSSIRVLPVHLVNKIAAGEVIERPASAVKELVENALDAGASRIDISVADGGRKSISVTDDGAGMTGEDLALAFAPHATSKIITDADLAAIDTMGFRGEALASIASISHAHIRARSRGAADEGGYEVEASGESVGDVRPCAAAPGTAITVRDLFFNMPARRKFMRTAATEFAHIVEQLARLSLPRPQVAFTITHNGRQTHNLPVAATTSQRVADLFGGELAQSLLPLSGRGGEVGVAGLIAPPAAARGSGKWQYFFLNGRYIRDRLLSHALREAFRGLVDPSRWPVGFIFIEIDPAEVDVNVHPTKIEVRFRNGHLVHGEVLAALRETLNKASLAPSAELSASEAAGLDEHQGDDAEDARRKSLRQAMADFFKSVPSPQPRLSFPEAAPASPSAPPPYQGQSRYHAPPASSHSSAMSPADHAQPETKTAIAIESPLHGSPEIIQIDNTYLVAPVADGLIIVDQHALHERLIYNDLKRRVAGGSLTGQRLLIPATLRVTAAEADMLAGHGELLASLGIGVEPFGPDIVAVQQFPAMLAERNVRPEQFIRELLDRLGDCEATTPEAVLDDLLAMMACKGAVKAGDALGQAEMAELLARRDEAEQASACPHGRPTTLKLSIKDLQKQFKRT